MAEQQLELPDTLGVAFEFLMSNVHTSTVARVTGVNAKTINCKPVVNRLVDGRDVELPEFVDVLSVTLQGGSSYIQMPLSVGDYCILIFAERCFDKWYEGIDFSQPAEYRMHDYSDGIAIVGINPRASEIPNVDTTRIQGDVNAEGNWDIDGDLNVTGTITCNRLVVDGIEFGTHVHDENDDGGPTDGPKNP